jgi:hypothetical protein
MLSRPPVVVLSVVLGGCYVYGLVALSLIFPR